MRHQFLRIFTSLGIAAAVCIAVLLFFGVIYDTKGLLSYYNLTHYRDALQENVANLKQTQQHLRQLQAESASALALKQLYTNGYTASGEYVVEVHGYVPEVVELHPGSITLSQYTHQDRRELFRIIAIFVGAVVALLLVFTDVLLVVDEYPRRRYKRNKLSVQPPTV